MSDPISPLPWLEPGELFPSVEKSWGTGSDAPGLLAAGGDLSVRTLRNAYSKGIFPWFSEGQPILWWSTDPRMVLQVERFKLHRSLRKTVLRFINDSTCEIRVDSAFSKVIAACASSPRPGQPGTWILPEMVDAYTRMHEAGFAHSVETWMHGELVGGLYCVTLGHAVFGESMFTRVTDASKIALAALVALCQAEGLPLVDCQQNTAHLASLGATEMPRTDFLARVRHEAAQPPAHWRFDPLYWNQFLST